MGCFISGYYLNAKENEFSKEFSTLIQTIKGQYETFDFFVLGLLSNVDRQEISNLITKSIQF